jgi:energy-converting hydrogenase Eha subunit A
MAYFRNPFNACLSITILPTEVGRIVNVDNPYVYKLFFQLIFAACPVLVYAISRRYWPRPVAILAAAYFMGFPTFFTDMPFLNRQEIAFLFVCAAILAITNAGWSVRTRQAALVAASVGMELAHYSTMYLFIGTLVVAWAAWHAYALSGRIWRRQRSMAQAGAAWAATARTVGIGSILVVVAFAFAWGQLATQTAAGAVTDVDSAVSGLIGHSASARSGDVSYSLLFGTTAGPQTVLNEYRQESFRARAGAPVGSYVPAGLVNRYPAPTLAGDGSLPLTGAGRLLSRIGVPVAALNSALRQAAARGEQLFVGIGLITCLIVARVRRRISCEYFFLCVGSVAMVAVITFLPDISTDYGVLRAFQEALILISPVLAAGSVTVFRPLGPVRGQRAAATVCIVLLVSTIGLMPQLLGGYPAQLSLNNSGSYYDMYYLHPQEEAAVAWLAGKPGVLPGGLQASYMPDRFAFTGLSDVTGQQAITDIYPPLVRQSSWLILGYSTVHTGLATTFYDGDTITYSYPTGFLRASKNLVYNNGGAEIYK